MLAAGVWSVWLSLGLTGAAFTPPTGLAPPGGLAWFVALALWVGLTPRVLALQPGAQRKRPESACVARPQGVSLPRGRG